MGMFSRNPLLAEVYRDVTDQFRFRIKSRNGEIVLSSEAYTRKLSAIKTLQMLQKNGLTMTIEDLT
jgi:hypothetical protein